MNARPHPQNLSSRAFTLIEMLIVLTIGGILLTAATTLLVNMTLLRSFPDSGLQFQLHCSNLQRFLEAGLNNETMPPVVENTSSAQNTDTAGGDDTNNRTAPNPSQQAGTSTPTTIENKTIFAWLPEESESREPALEFSLVGDLPILEGTPEVNRSVRAQIRLSEEDGLFLIWYYPARENSTDDFEIYQRRLSPWVHTIEYAYYDSEFETWDLEESPVRDSNTREYTLPEYIVLSLKDGNSDAESKLQILLPSSESEVPHP
jgi:prepilin-type N-terminal cleavage/methylation domain-containing protein